MIFIIYVIFIFATTVVMWPSSDEEMKLSNHNFKNSIFLHRTCDVLLLNIGAEK